MNRYMKISMSVVLVLVTLFALNLLTYASDRVKNSQENQKLINDLKSEKSDDRTKAATKLGDRKVVEAVNPLLQMLKREEHQSARIVAAVALSKIGDKSVVPTLKTIQKSETNKTVKNVLNAVIKKLDNA